MSLRKVKAKFEQLLKQIKSGSKKEGVRTLMMLGYQTRSDTIREVAKEITRELNYLKDDVEAHYEKVKNPKENFIRGIDKIKNDLQDLVEKSKNKWEQDNELNK